MPCKKLYAAAALCLLPVSALAVPKTTPGDLPDLPLETLYFGGENPVLTPAEQKALKIARDWQARSATQLTPVPGLDGAIRFLHGFRRSLLRRRGPHGLRGRSRLHLQAP